MIESYTFLAGWRIDDHAAYRLEDEVRKATVFALANGYMSSRGAPESAPLSEPGIVGHHINGLYDTPDGDILKREIINLPAWTPLSLEIDGQPLEISGSSSYTRSLDLRRGLLIQDVTWTVNGKTITLHSERLVSMARLHLGLIHWRLSSDHDCELTLCSAVAAAVTNRFAATHFSQIDVRPDGIIVTTIEQLQQAAVFVAHTLTGSAAAPQIDTLPQRTQTTWHLTLPADQPVTLTKYAAVYDSRFSSGDLSALCRAELDRALQTGYERSCAEHIAQWARLWSTSDVVIEGDEDSQIALRFCLFHLLSNIPHSDQVSISARGLEGQDYWGSIYWDYEIYVLPFFTYTQPAYARPSLIYRYHTLPGALRKAEGLGYRGAYYAWQSQETGDETTALYVFTDPRTGQKIRSYFADEQIHISADIAYAIWQYVQATGDESFLADYGLPILIEVARFFISRVTYHPGAGRFELRTVLGPDEYHERIDNNAYTNALARYSLQITLEALRRVPHTLPDDEINTFHNVLQKLYVPEPAPASGLIEQFDGYFALEDAPPDVVRARLAHPDLHPGGPLGPYQTTQAIKQADVVLLLYLLRAHYQDSIKRANWAYYEPRTAHDSSLSPMAYALVAADIDLTDWAYRYFKQTALLDLLGTGPHWNLGVHTAALGGAWQTVVLGFCKLDLQEDSVVLRGWPHFPSGWQRVQFHFYWHGHLLHFSATNDSVTLQAESGPVPLSYPDGKVTLSAQQPLTLTRSSV